MEGNRMRKKGDGMQVSSDWLATVLGPVNAEWL